MIDNRTQELHDKATRGATLSEAEQAELDAWYAAQDTAESQLLADAAPSQSLTHLQADVQAAVTQIRVASLRIQALAEQNEAIRQEVTALQRQLAQQTPRAA
jgi:hypothetical protein